MKTPILKWAHLTTLTLAATIGVLLGTRGETISWTLIALITLFLVFPLLYRIAQGKFDVFEPVVWFSLSMMLFIVLRTYAVISTASYEWRGLDSRPGLDKMLVISLVGVAAWMAGYFIPASQRVASSLPPLPREFSGLALRLYVLLVVGVAITAFALFMRQAGLTIDWLWSGREVSDTIYRESVGYLYSAPFLLVPCFLLTIALWQQGAKLYSMVLLPLIGIVLYSQAAKGNRLFLMLALLSVVVFWYMSRSRRPSPIVILLVLPIAFIGFTTLREIREISSNTSTYEVMTSTIRNPRDAWNDIVLGADAEAGQGLMYLATILPSELPYAPGSSIFSVLAQPIPRALWPEKPMIPEERVMEYVFPADYARNRAGATFTAMGSFYTDSGMPSVLLGMFSMGFFFRTTWLYCTRLPSVAGIAVASMLPALVVSFSRASLAPTAMFVFWTVLPLLVAVLVAGKTKRDSKSSPAPRSSKYPVTSIPA